MPATNTPRHRIEVGRDPDGVWWCQVVDTETGWSQKSWPFPNARAARRDAEQLVTHREHGTVRP